MCTYFMALRVLLADESSTIKKVMQLALQDFGVEVKAVPIGLDVVQVSRSFKPDIIFADVLLSKRNGYEVSMDVKSDSVLNKTPVVLMWSSFMEIDEAKVQECRADRKIEKPFDAETLRALVKELVHTTSSNLISNYLSFPDLPPIIDEKPPAAPSPSQKAPVASEEIPTFNFDSLEHQTNNRIHAAKNNDSEIDFGSLDADAIDLSSLDVQTSPIEAPEGFNFSLESQTHAEPAYEPIVIDDIEEPEEFQAVPLPRNRGNNKTEKLAERIEAAKNPVFEGTKTNTKIGVKKPSEDWSHQDLSKFKIDLPMDDQFDLGESDLTNTSIALSSGVEEISLDEIENPKAILRQQQTKAPAKSFQSQTANNNLEANMKILDPMRAEELIRQEVRQVLETIAWKVLPEIAERVVREEIQKLLKDAEQI